MNKLAVSINKLSQYQAFAISQGLQFNGEFFVSFVKIILFSCLGVKFLTNQKHTLRQPETRIGRNTKPDTGPTITLVKIIGNPAATCKFQLISCPVCEQVIRMKSLFHQRWHGCFSERWRRGCSFSWSGGRS